MIQFRFVLLQIGSSFVLDQVSGIFFFPGNLLNLAEDIVVAFTDLGAG